MPQSRLPKIAGLLVGAVYAGVSLLYIWWPAGWSATARIGAKAAPILMLAVVLNVLLRRSGTLPTAALVFSAAGDISGDLGPRGFLPSIALFGVAQMLYTAHFIRFWRWRRQRLPALTLCLVWLAVMVWQLAGAQALGAPLLKGMVFCYIAVIMAMVVSALFASGMPVWLPVGAVLFLASDSLIAIDRFLHDIPHAGVWVMLTYAAAQGCLTLGVVLKHVEHRSMPVLS